MKTEKIGILEKGGYVAEDGTWFDNCYECMKYDVDLLAEGLQIYDYNFQRSDPFCAWYAVLKTEEEIEKFRSICALLDDSARRLDKTGIYVYISEKEEWINIYEIMEKLGEQNDV